jgi:hypothetical protein
MLPTLSDTPEVATNKLALVEKMLADKQNADVGALGSQGYDTSGFQQLEEKSLPGILSKGLVKEKRGLVAAPSASGGPKVGTVENGYVFLGGDPAKPKSWKKK